MKEKNLKPPDFIGILNFTFFKTTDFSGELGIRTPGGVTLNGFQDRRNRPLCQLSAAKVRLEVLIKKLIAIFFLKFLSEENYASYIDKK